MLEWADNAVVVSLPRPQPVLAASRARWCRTDLDRRGRDQPDTTLGTTPVGICFTRHRETVSRAGGVSRRS
jgi:hypothetical protein